MKRTTIWLGMLLMSMRVLTGQTTHIWTGGAGDWSDATKWDPQGVPGADDTAVITKANSRVNLDADVSVASLEMEATRIDGDFKLSVSTSASIRRNAILTGDSTLEIAEQATLSLSDGMTFIKRSMNNRGAIITNAAVIRMQQLAHFNNLEGGTLTTESGKFNLTDVGGGGPALNNAGTVIVAMEEPDTRATFGVIVNNSGTIRVNRGHMDCQKGGTSNGKISTAEDGTLTLRAAFDITVAADEVLTSPSKVTVVGNTTVSGDGRYDVTVTEVQGNLEFNLEAETETLIQGRGNLKGTGSLTVTDSYQWEGGAVLTPLTVNVTTEATLTADNQWVTIQGTLNNHGTMTLTGNKARFQLGTTGVVNNLEGATMELLFAGPIGANALHNEGTMIFSPPEGKTQSFSLATFTNRGQIEFREGSYGAGVNVELVQTAGSTTLVGAELGMAVTLEGGILTGEGLIQGNLINGGTVSPGFAEGERGRITIDRGIYTQTAQGTLAIDVCTGDADSGIDHDELVITAPSGLFGGKAILGGHAEVRLADDCVLGEDEGFTALSAQLGIEGTFDSFTGDPVGNGQYLDVFYEDVIRMAATDPIGVFIDVKLNEQRHPSAILTGVAGQHYEVRSTEDLSDPNSWIPIFDGIIPGNKLLEFVDDRDREGITERYFRAVHLPDTD